MFHLLVLLEDSNLTIEDVEETLKEWRMIDIKNYNNENIFAKILRHENFEKVFENDMFTPLKISTLTPIHILVIPKNLFVVLQIFQKADAKFMHEFIRSINLIAEELGLKEGYRLITNIGKYGGQEVPHLHFHLLSGKKIGKMVST